MPHHTHRVSGSRDPRKGLQICMPTRFPNDADDAGLGLTLFQIPVTDESYYFATYQISMTQEVFKKRSTVLLKS